MNENFCQTHLSGQSEGVSRIDPPLYDSRLLASFEQEARREQSGKISKFFSRNGIFVPVTVVRAIPADSPWTATARYILPDPPNRNPPVHSPPRRGELFQGRCQAGGPRS